QSVIDKMRGCVNSGDLRQLRSFNFQFHDLLVYCSRNQKVIETYILLAKQVRWAAALSLGLPDSPVRSTQEHVSIFEAFKQRDAKKVRTLMEKHTDDSMERILSQLRRKERKGD
ncbi:MAG: FCD domain-containing protein, partial [Proteobacteria bacterium]|nr:FCD domain-containing protein [Pseudomonadota bacterium]